MATVPADEVVNRLILEKDLPSPLGGLPDLKIPGIVVIMALERSPVLKLGLAFLEGLRRWEFAFLVYRRL
ncbi:MAG: hypothetical protein WBI82_01635 [Sphaerochaeta sp.]